MTSPPRLFGTDGIRARFGEAPLDRPTVTRLGEHLGALLGRLDGRPSVVLGGDTRASTPTLDSWLVDGLARSGVDCVDVGVLPTPAIAHLVAGYGATAGIAISASHNPYHDNGIKLLDERGSKWSREREMELEARMATGGIGKPAEPGERRDDAKAAAATYLQHLLASAGGKGSLDGLKVAIDAANGAASSFAAPLFRRLGCEVAVIHDAPDGQNINRDCGSTHPEVVARLTKEVGAALGIAFDGDADRAVLADETGVVRDGDAILYLWARELFDRDALSPASIVATTMSNLGLEKALASHGIATVRCDVGDREVVEAMIREGIDLGGEQSGHIVHLPSGRTGDGMVTALQIARIVHRRGQPFSELLQSLERYPQLLRNVPVHRKVPFETLPQVQAAAASVEEKLAGDGRLVLRYSGTEMLARIMLEGPDQTFIESLASELEGVLQEALA